jgi:hypothetical protein
MGMSMNRTARTAAVLCILGIDLCLGQIATVQGLPDRQAHLGREISVRDHLRGGEEFSLTTIALVFHGRLLFNANWTEEEGAGRPLTKGTGRPLSDSSLPLTGLRAFKSFFRTGCELVCRLS